MWALDFLWLWQWSWTRRQWPRSDRLFFLWTEGPRIGWVSPLSEPRQGHWLKALHTCPRLQPPPKRDSKDHTAVVYVVPIRVRNLWNDECHCLRIWFDKLEPIVLRIYGLSVLSPLDSRPRVAAHLQLEHGGTTNRRINVSQRSQDLRRLRLLREGYTPWVQKMEGKKVWLYFYQRNSLSFNFMENRIDNFDAWWIAGFQWSPRQLLGL